MVIDTVDSLLDSAVGLVNEAATQMREFAARMINSVKQTAEAIRTAIREIAAKISRPFRQLLKMKKFYIWEDLWPEVYDFKTDYLTAVPLFILPYNGRNSPITRNNRRWVRSTYGQRPAPLSATGGLQDLDEYPYASTALGGNPFAWGRYVNRSQNRSEGASLKNFYRRRLKYAPGRTFLVVPVPSILNLANPLTKVVR